MSETPFGRGDYSPTGTYNAILLSDELLARLSDAPDRAGLAGWLASLPCPVIGLGPDGDEVCDAIVQSDADLEAVLANIDRAPVAAMTLVQVLRATSRMGVAEGLTLESLAYGTLQKGREHLVWHATRGVSEPGIEPAASVLNSAPVLLERDRDTLAIRLNRPERLNAISVEIRDALCEALQLVGSDSTIRAVTVSGNGRCFSIGGDLDEFGTTPDPATAHAVRSVRLPALQLSQCADRVTFRLHGACIGAGIELPAFGHRVIAAKNTFFQLPEIRYGLIPGAGGCVGIPRRIGRQRTAYLALSARRISAVNALAWGLIDAIED